MDKAVCAKMLIIDFAKSLYGRVGDKSAGYAYMTSEGLGLL